MGKRKSESTPKTDKRKAPRSAWKPGQSGNPGGRPPLTEAQREAREARAAAQPSAVARLVAIIADPASKDQDAIAASKVILEGLEPLKMELDASVKAEVQHELREVVSTPERLAKIAAVLVRAQALPATEEKTETAAPVETKEAT